MKIVIICVGVLLASLLPIFIMIVGTYFLEKLSEDTIKKIQVNIIIFVIAVLCILFAKLTFDILSGWLG